MSGHVAGFGSQERVAAEVGSVIQGDQSERVREILRETAQVSIAMAREHAALVAEIAAVVTDRLRQGGKVVFLGNGGSAADAQHLAAELMGRFQYERPALPAIALNTNTSILTAIGNDYSYDDVFTRQVEALVTDKDVVVGISTSGSSPNILKAMKAAHKRGACCIGFTGQRGQELASVCDLCLMVPSVVTARIQESHIVAGHALCELVEASMVEPGYRVDK